MKKLIYIFILLILSCAAPKKCCAQDTIQVPQEELDDIIATMDTLIEQDSINNVIIEQQAVQLKNYYTLSMQDSALLAYKAQEVELLSQQIKLYEERIKVIDKWYNRRPFGFILGLTTSIVLIHTVGYTLP
jgi:hypothetical protein